MRGPGKADKGGFKIFDDRGGFGLTPLFHISVSYRQCLNKQASPIGGVGGGTTPLPPRAADPPPPLATSKASRHFFGFFRV